MKLKPGTLNETTWDAVRLQVKDVAPDIFDAIEAMSPDSSYTLYEATYPYGAYLSRGNKFILPSDEDSRFSSTLKSTEKMKDDLCYLSGYAVPFGLVLDGQLQLSKEERNEIAKPERIFTKGNFFALHAVLDFPDRYQPCNYWNMISGARTVYMLASIANKTKFKYIQQEFGKDIDLPLEQVDHWAFFKQLSNSSAFKKSWCNRLLFFGKKWIFNLKENPSLRLALADRLIKGTALDRNSNSFNKFWDGFVPTVRNKKVDRYILTMARYILEASIGREISFKVANSSDDTGPFTEIAKIICEVYGLEKCAPIIMVPAHRNPIAQERNYVSIQLPTIDIERNYINKHNFLMADFREIHYVINKFLHNTKPQGIGSASIYDFTRYNYNFYSADKDRFGVFAPASTVFDGDQNLDYWLNLGGDAINVRNDFMRAVVSLSMK